MTKQRKQFYTGLRAPSIDVFHCPLIKIEPLQNGIDAYHEALPKASHALFTSQTSIELVGTPNLPTIAVGTETAKHLDNPLIAPEATSEGVVELLKTLDIDFLLWPHSALSRDVIPNYLKNIPHAAPAIYTTTTRIPDPLPDPFQYEVVFTSPSTVHAFIEIWGKLPEKYQYIGPTTKKAIESVNLRRKC